MRHPDLPLSNNMGSSIGPERAVVESRILLKLVLGGVKIVALSIMVHCT